MVSAFYEALASEIHYFEVRAVGMGRTTPLFYPRYLYPSQLLGQPEPRRLAPHDVLTIASATRHTATNIFFISSFLT